MSTISDHGFWQGLTRASGSPAPSNRDSVVSQLSVARSAGPSTVMSAQMSVTMSAALASSPMTSPYHVDRASNAPPEVPLIPTSR